MSQPSEELVMSLAEIFGPDLLIVIGVIVLIFGATRLPKLARALGSSAREFRKGMEGDAEDGSKAGSKAEAPSTSSKGASDPAPPTPARPTSPPEPDATG